MTSSDLFKLVAWNLRWSSKIEMQAIAIKNYEIFLREKLRPSTKLHKVIDKLDDG